LLSKKRVEPIARVTLEISWDLVLGLQKRNTGDDMATSLENAIELSDAALRVFNVFKYGNGEHRVECFISERHRIGGALDINVGSRLVLPTYLLVDEFSFNHCGDITSTRARV
jgi:hypothetical protein